jgi:hypothetical protein
MREKIKKIWKEPVGSKIIANSVWVFIVALVTGIYLLYQRISLSMFIKPENLHNIYLVDYLNVFNRAEPGN